MSISKASDICRTAWGDFLIFRNSRSEVAVNRAAGDFPEHLHEFAEISLIVSGSALHFMSGLEAGVRQGCLVVALQGDRHGYRDSSSDFKRMNVQVRTGLFKMRIEELKASGLDTSIFEGAYMKSGSWGALPQACFSKCVSLASGMEREWVEERKGFAGLLGFRLGELLVLIMRGLAEKEVPYGKAKEGSRTGMAAAVALLDSEYARRIGIDELAHAAGMGRRSFERAFRLETGMPPKKYLMKTRISWACRMLSKGELRIQEALHACGFSDQNYFTRAFKLYSGMTPGEFVSLARGRSKDRI